MKKSLLALSIGSLMAAPVVTHAVDATLSGHINRALLYGDNGEDSDVLHVDNDNSSTRFRFVGENDVGKGLKAGVVWESQFESNSSASADIDQNDDGDDPTLSERKLEAYLAGAWGKVTIGQGDGAANGTSEVDLSGTGVVAYSGVEDLGGGLTWRNSAGSPVDSAGNPLLPTVTTGRFSVGAAFNNFDGLSRNDRLRYDTPNFGPLVLSASFTNGDAGEVAARLSTEIGPGELAAAFGFVDTADRDTPCTACEFEQWGASASYLLNSGFNLTLALGNRDTDGGTDSDHYYVKGGYKFGDHAVSIDFDQLDDFVAKGSEATSAAGAYAYSGLKSVQLYAAYRQYSHDGPDLQDVDALMAGARVKF